MTLPDLDWIEDMPEADRQADGLERVADSAELRLYNFVRQEFDEALSSKKYSRKELADTLGVSTSLVSRWLVRPSNMTIRSAAKILFAMKKDLGFTGEVTGRSKNLGKYTGAPTNGQVLSVTFSQKPAWDVWHHPQSRGVEQVLEVDE